MRGGRDEAEFVEYLQWLAHTQLQECTELAKALHLKVGLYLDVAVGVRADGFDAWMEQEAIHASSRWAHRPICSTRQGRIGGWPVSTGRASRHVASSHIRAMIEASARYAGAIRLDHVMGLARLFLVPSGFSPRDGAYVTMPLEALLGVTALESQARRCIIIGEDLGTVPEGFREKLQRLGRVVVSGHAVRARVRRTLQVARTILIARARHVQHA